MQAVNQRLRPITKHAQLTHQIALLPSPATVDEPVRQVVNGFPCGGVAIC